MVEVQVRDHQAATPEPKLSAAMNLRTKAKWMTASQLLATSKVETSLALALFLVRREAWTVLSLRTKTQIGTSCSSMSSRPHSLNSSRQWRTQRQNWMGPHPKSALRRTCNRARVTELRPLRHRKRASLLTAQRSISIRILVRQVSR